ncbi:MAG: hypothetical protein WAL98_09395 [Desulfatiglandaceae bacterium]
MKADCRAHRKSMQLLGLKIRLKQGISDPKEQIRVEERIRELEKELQMD